MEGIMATLQPIIEAIQGIFTGGGEEGFDFSTIIETITNFISSIMGE